MWPYWIYFYIFPNEKRKIILIKMPRARLKNLMKYFYDFIL